MNKKLLFSILRVLAIAILCNTAYTSSAQAIENDSICGDAIIGPGVTAHTVVDPLCFSCDIVGEANVVNADLSDYAVFTLLAAPIGNGVELQVANAQAIYPGGYEVGFVIGSPGGLLDAATISALTLTTYLNGIPQDTGTIANGLLGAHVLAGNASLQEISFVTNNNFDEIRLFADGGLVTSTTTVHVYYAFEQPANACGFSCLEAITNTSYGASINPDRTGLGGICIGCSVSDTALVVDGDTSNAGNIEIPIGVLSSGSISVETPNSFPVGTEVGFVIEDNDGLLNLLNATVLGAITLRTYHNDVLQEAYLGSAGAVSASLLEGSNTLNRLSFKADSTFDEVRITVTGLVGLGLDINVYYAFVVADSDNDGVADCADQCPNGNDLIDSDGDGIPDACDGIVCTPGDTEFLEDNDICNDAINGVGVRVSSNVTALCVACSVVDESNVIDGDLGNYADLNLDISPLLAGVGLSVRDTVRYYPAGHEAGFVVGSGNGLIDASILGAVTISTYRRDTLQESATTVNGLLQASGVYGGTLPRQRLGFVTTLDFDEVRIFIDGGLLSAMTNLQVYNAYEQPADCPDSCVEAFTNTGHGAEINADRTGYNALLCINCAVSDTAFVVDADTTNAGNIDIPLGVLGTGYLSVVMDTSYPAGTFAGFVIEADDGLFGLLDADVLSAITIHTYEDDMLQESVDGSSAVVGAGLLPGSTTLNTIGFPTTMDFDEIQIEIGSLLGVDLDINVYYAFYILDDDNDGVGNCQDLCANGNDLLDSDGDGVPDFCDSDNECSCYVLGNCIVAVNDTTSIAEGDSALVIELDNDIIGNPLDTSSIAVVSGPDNGQTTVNTDGTIRYWPSGGFMGVDSFRYQICDTLSPTFCDTATIYVTVQAVYVRLNARALLQGALLNAADTLMTDSLRSLGFIPMTEPYDGLADFSHVNGGGATVTDSAEVFAAKGANSVVDWVFIELRDPADSTKTLASRAGLIRRDGWVVDKDGTSLLWFGQSLPGNYFVAIRHRNHLGVMTKTAVPLSEMGTEVDFTDLNNDFWEESSGFDGREQDTINGRYAMWAGNTFTNDELVFAGQDNDKDPIFNDVDGAPANILKLQTFQYLGYHLGDVNLDGRTIFAGQSNDVDPIFNNVDGFPLNILKLQTFVLREQLPD